MNRTAFAADVRSITLTRWGIVRSHGTAVLSNKAATATQRDRHRLCAAEPVPAALDFALERDWLGYRYHPS